jgi:predicted aspartyl protease
LLDADGDFLCSSPVVSLFRVNVVARNPKREEVQTPAVEALVDTRSELTWLPRDLLNQAGITPRRQRTFRTATTQTVTREVGYAILAADGYETADEVVLAEPGDMILLGVRTLEGFGVAVTTAGTACGAGDHRRRIVRTSGTRLTPAAGCDTKWRYPRNVC